MHRHLDVDNAGGGSVRQLGISAGRSGLVILRQITIVINISECPQEVGSPPLFLLYASRGWGLYIPVYPKG